MTINYCPECGSKITKSTSFCGECGTKVLFTEEIIKPVKLYCHSCDYSTIEEEKFCPNCGSILTCNIIDITRNKIKSKPRVKTQPAKSGLTTPQTQKNSLLRNKWITAIVVLAISFMVYNFSYIKWDNSTTNNNSAQTKKEFKIRQANPILSETKSFPLLPTSKIQVLSYSDKVTVTLPPNFTSVKQNINISKAEVDATIIAEDMTPLVLIDLTLDNKEQPSQPIDVTFSYELKELNLDNTATEQLVAFRWDEVGGGWASLPIRVDEKNQKISVLVDHFSVISVVKILNDFIKGIDNYDKVNNIYTTPEKNFHILYSKQQIKDSNVLYDRAWKSQYSRPGYKYKTHFPRYIQDIGYFLESALNVYADSYGFKSPAGQEKFLKWTYQKSVIVKIDSWYSKVTAFENPFSSSSEGLPSYDKIFERLHIPTSNAAGPDGAQITTAHELFHAFQAQYYGLPGMAKPMNQWWLEATAEYAAYGMVWPSLIGEMKHGLGVNFLSFPINSTGNKSHTSIGWSDSPYEYKASVWIKYLVDNGMNLKKAIINDASDYSPSINSLESFLMKEYRVSLVDLYRNFSNWMIFSSKGILKGYPIASFNNNSDRDIAIKQNKYTLGSNSLSYFFNLHGSYSTSLWAIKINQEDHVQIKGRAPVFIKLKSKSAGVDANVFVLPKGSRTLINYAPLKLLTTEGQTFKVMVKDGDIVCISSTIGAFDGGIAEVIINSGITLEIDPPQINNVIADSSSYFTVTAKNIPKEIEKVSFEWDYSDG